MPAYMNPLIYLCNRCLKNATHEVFNTYNASMGVFCKQCANKEIRRLNDISKIKLVRAIQICDTCRGVK